MLTRAFNNPGLSDHNHEHSRRHERWLESMFLNIGELRHSHSVFTWLDSAMLFSYWHDVDQLLSLERNFTEGTNFPVKRGHALAAAAMVFALSDRYAVERKVSKHRAWEICGGAALMIARHDLPERFAAGLAGMAKAYNQNPDGTRELLRGEELKKLFDKNELDLFTMAPSQLMELLTMEKAGSGFVDPARDQTWGLLPSFEDEYMTKLVALAHNDRPIFGDISPEDRMVYRYGAGAVVLADVFDMVAPPIESIMRKLNTQHAQRRPFYRSEMDVLSQLSQIRDSVGNIDHQFDSDVRRVLWELVHMEHIKDGVIAESPYVNSINRDVAIMAALSFKDIGQRIMAGDLTDIERHYQFRKSQVARKTLAKANYSKIRRILVDRPRLLSGDDRQVVELLERHGDRELLRRYKEKITNLEAEAQAIQSTFFQKPGSDGNSVRVYEDGDIEAFAALCDAAIASLCEKYTIPQKRLKRYRAKVARGKYPPSTPYMTYDSIGGKPRTLVAPLGVANGNKTSYHQAA